MKWLRFAQLKARGIVNSWPQLKRLQEHGFPRGRMLGPNIRAWTEEEIEEWEASRPVAGPPLRGAAKARRERKAAEPPPEADSAADPQQPGAEA